ncbi:MAG: TIGR02266 family protein [Polyangiaceae bacterium]|nr:TIGR02266 family protein [Polyangiaceae bacterium]
MFLADYTRNISKGGTFIQTDNPLPIDTIFHFFLVVPGIKDPFELIGKVVWAVTEIDASPANPAGMGIEFQHRDDGDRKRIDATVRAVMVAQLGPNITSKLLDEK